MIDWARFQSGAYRQIKVSEDVGEGVDSGEHMSTTLFAGAGLSRAVSEKVQYCGNMILKMPLSNDMFDNESAQDYLRKPQFRQAYGILADYLFGKYGTSTPRANYEEVYSASNDICPKAAEQLEGMIFEHLGGNYPPIRYDIEVRQTIRIIRSFLCNYTVTNIISTNPDILLEVAVIGSTQFDEEFADIFGITELRIDRGFPGGQPVLSKRDGWPQLRAIKRLIKIHGSLLLLKPQNIGDPYLWPEYYVWNKGSAHAKYVKETYGLCVIPPMKDKSIYYGDEPYRTLLANAIKVLGKSDTIIFYGYGFNETNDCGLSKSMQGILEGKRVIVFDIEGNIRNEKYRSCVYRFLGINTYRSNVEFRRASLNI